MLIFSYILNIYLSVFVSVFRLYLLFDIILAQYRLKKDHWSFIKSYTWKETYLYIIL